MAHATTNVVPFPVRRPATPFFRALGAVLNSLVHDLSDDYRPEKHYMRGPGPKWQAKYGRVSADAVPAAQVAA
jgi:hypothetical protein